MAWMPWRDRRRPFLFKKTAEVSVPRAWAAKPPVQWRAKWRLISGGDAWLRTGPGTQYAKAGVARNGEKYVNANPDGWVPVLIGGEIRWISGKYAKVVETA